MARRPTGSLRRGWTTGACAAGAAREVALAAGVDVVVFDRHDATLAHAGH